jgi:hypothetical protein
VRDNVSQTLVSHVPLKIDLTGPQWTATHPCAVLLAKVGTLYFLYVNVQVGQLISPYQDFPGSLANPQNISHVSCFDCG